MWFTILLAVIGWVEALVSEPVGGPPAPLPPLNITWGGSTYQIVATGQKVK